MYQAMYAKVADSLRQTGQFRETEQWRFDWEQPYTRAQWLDLLPTTGDLTQLPPDPLTEILDAVGRPIDSLGGRFTMQYITLATPALRAGARRLRERTGTQNTQSPTPATGSRRATRRPNGSRAHDVQSTWVCQMLPFQDADYGGPMKPHS